MEGSPHSRAEGLAAGSLGAWFPETAPAQSRHDSSPHELIRLDETCHFVTQGGATRPLILPPPCGCALLGLRAPSGNRLPVHTL